MFITIIKSLGVGILSAIAGSFLWIILLIPLSALALIVGPVAKKLNIFTLRKVRHISAYSAICASIAIINSVVIHYIELSIFVLNSVFIIYLLYFLPQNNGVVFFDICDSDEETFSRLINNTQRIGFVIYMLTFYLSLYLFR